MVLAVNTGDDKSTIESYWKASDYTFTAVRQSEGAVSRAFGVKAYPTNYVIGPDGKVLFRSVGYDQSKIARALESTKKKD